MRAADSRLGSAARIRLGDATCCAWQEHLLRDDPRGCLLGQVAFPADATTPVLVASAMHCSKEFLRIAGTVRQRQILIFI
jgi:hypothetical protein